MSFPTKVQAKTRSNYNIHSNPQYGPWPLIKMNPTACPGLGGGPKIIFYPRFIMFDHFQPIWKEKTVKIATSKTAPKWPFGPLINMTPTAP